MQENIQSMKLINHTTTSEEGGPQLIVQNAPVAMTPDITPLFSHRR